MEILSVSNNHEVWVALIPAFIIAILFFAGCLEGIDNKNWLQVILCGLVSVVIIMGTPILCYFESQKETLRVVISDMNQVDFDTYEIVENDGKIIILKEK